MFGLVQLLLRESAIALLLGGAALLLTGRTPVFMAIGFILSLVTAGVYASGHAIVGRLRFIPSGLHRAATALCALLLGWLLLVPLLGGAGPTVRSLIGQLVTLYVGLRFLSELLWPVVPVRRTLIKDHVVAQAERLLRRPARPYATRPDGSLDEEAVSFPVEAAEAESSRGALAEALSPHPVIISLEGEQLVIRPAPAPGGSV